MAHFSRITPDKVNPSGGSPHKQTHGNCCYTTLKGWMHFTLPKGAITNPFPNRPVTNKDQQTFPYEGAIAISALTLLAGHK